MNNDNSELIEYLDEKFNGLDGKLDQKADKNDLANLATKDDLLKLVTLEEFDQFKKEINEKIDGLREDIRTLVASVDGFAKIITDYTDEHKLLSAKILRHERWIQQLAEKTGVELEEA